MGRFLMSGVILLVRLLRGHRLATGPCLYPRPLLLIHLLNPDFPGLSFVIQELRLTPHPQRDGKTKQKTLVGRG